MDFFFQALVVIRGVGVPGVQACALPVGWEHALRRKLAARAGAAVPRLDRLRNRALRTTPPSLPDRLTRRSHSGQRRMEDRKSVVQGKSEDLGGRRIIKKREGTGHKEDNG